MRCHALTVLSSIGLLLLGASAWAKPAHKKALADFLGPRLAPRLNDCRTCHLPDAPGGVEGSDKPHNPFGARLAAVRDELKKAGKKSDIADRIRAIANEDSDGDGVPNLLELLAGHNPGDKADRPSAAELDKALQVQTAFLKEIESRSWSAFEPVRRPPLPQTRNPKSPIRNSIDLFIAAEHARQGLKPRPEAAREVLLRRASLDLIGLPPTREELRAFLADASSNAYEKVVDRLLNDPRHGERWGRHWMDVWRYSDWAGYGEEARDSMRHIWHWRDWIVESLNADKGYDRMVQEMLAGDEIAPDDANTVRATGFLARNWFLFNRNVWLENIVEHSGKAFLGVTLNCARCHDHFYDPISQKEYYQFRAIFEPHRVRTDRVPGQADVAKDGLPRVYDAEAGALTYLFTRGDESKPDKSKALPPGVPAALGGIAFKPEPVKMTASAIAPDKRPFVIEELIKSGAESIRLAKIAVDTARKTKGDVALAEADLAVAEARHQAILLVLQVERLEDAGKKGSDEWKKVAEQTVVAQRQQTIREAAKALVLAKQPPQKLAAEQALKKAETDAKAPVTTAYRPRVVAVFPAASTGRRLALARWITDRSNPLASRVAVNHIWLRHFGSALVPTVFDFGKNGQPPTHPQLLDWLADELMAHGWSMKHIHRLIVTSSAYRMDSKTDPANVALDMDNRALWRMNVRRAEGEVVRDTLLHLGGQLDLTRGGPDIDQRQGLTVPRRSLYFRHSPEKQMEFLYLFDAASMVECYNRPVSIVPQQALALANSTLAQNQARLLARKLNDPADAAFIKAGFEAVLCRAPTVEEVTACEKFLTTQAALLADAKKLKLADGPESILPPSSDPKLRARESLILVLMNHNDFVTIR